MSFSQNEMSFEEVVMMADKSDRSTATMAANGPKNFEELSLNAAKKVGLSQLELSSASIGSVPSTSVPSSSTGSASTRSASTDTTTANEPKNFEELSINAAKKAESSSNGSSSNLHTITSTKPKQRINELYIFIFFLNNRSAYN